MTVRYRISGGKLPAFCQQSCRVCRFWMRPKETEKGHSDMGVCDRLGARLSEYSLCDRFDADPHYDKFDPDEAA